MALLPIRFAREVDALTRPGVLAPRPVDTPHGSIVSGWGPPTQSPRRTLGRMTSSRRRVLPSFRDHSVADLPPSTTLCSRGLLPDLSGQVPPVASETGKGPIPGRAGYLLMSNPASDIGSRFVACSEHALPTPVRLPVRPTALLRGAGSGRTATHGFVRAFTGAARQALRTLAVPPDCGYSSVFPNPAA